VNRRPVSSSNISSVGWEQDTMEVEFKSGHLYAYHEVPEALYQAMLGADSVGKFFSSTIAGKFEQTRVK
jgi:hypothetical protein